MKKVVAYAEVFWELDSDCDLVAQLKALGQGNNPLANPIHHSQCRTYVLSVLHSGERRLLDLDDPYFNPFQMEWNLEESWGQKTTLRLKLYNAPSIGFCHTKNSLRPEVKALLKSVIRDVAFTAPLQPEASTPLEATERLSSMLRNASILKKPERSFVVCWGGHTLPASEYLHAKQVGRELASLNLPLCTGAGAGAMQGPMEGAREVAPEGFLEGRSCVGLSDASLVEVEAPNPRVTAFVLMPNREMRLEAFLRLARGFVVFPGGVGTMEELATLIGVLSCKENANWNRPVILSATKQLESHVMEVSRFLRKTLGDEVEGYYEVVLGEPKQVASRMKSTARNEDRGGLNLDLHVPEGLRSPVEANHKTAAELFLRQETSMLKTALLLRKLFAVLVATSVDKGLIEFIRREGPVVLRGEAALIKPLERLLSQLVSEGFLHQNSDEPKRYRFVVC